MLTRLQGVSVETGPGLGGSSVAMTTEFGVETRQVVGCSGVDKTTELGVDRLDRSRRLWY